MGPKAASESSSANTANAAPAKRGDLGGRPGAERRRRVDARGHQHHRRVAIAGHAEVDRAGDPAVHVASARDRHRRPRPGHRATGRHRVDELDTGVAVENDQFAGGDVDRGEPQRPVRPVVRRQALRDHLAAHRLRERFRSPAPRPRSAASAVGSCPACPSYGSPRAVRNSSVMASTSTPESISADDSATCRSNSTSSGAAAADLRGDRRTGRGPDQHVRIQQQPGRRRRLVGDAAQNTCLPGDSRYPAAGQHERASGCHVAHSARPIRQLPVLRLLRPAGAQVLATQQMSGRVGQHHAAGDLQPASTWTSSPGASRRQRGSSSIRSVANTTDGRVHRCSDCAWIRLVRKSNSGSGAAARAVDPRQ